MQPMQRASLADELSGLDRDYKMAVDYGNLVVTLKNLESQHDNLARLSPDYPSFIHEGMAESVIQRFEICYDTVWKTLRRHLIVELVIDEVPNSPKPVFRIANENYLLADAGERWQLYAQTRIDTTHIYDAERAAAAVSLISIFIADAIDLYNVISGEPWQ